MKRRGGRAWSVHAVGGRPATARRREWPKAREEGDRRVAREHAERPRDEDGKGVTEPQAEGKTRPTEDRGRQQNQGSKIDRRDGFSVFLPSRPHSPWFGSSLPSFGCVSLTHPSPHLRLVSASGDERREEGERRETSKVRDDRGAGLETE